jgi:3-oxoacyl-[acyl-carrier protein] reductase
MKKLEGRVAIITGSTSGIGRSTALLFAKEGAKILIHGKPGEGEEEKAVSVVNEIRSFGGEAEYILVDLTGEPEVLKPIAEKAMDCFGSIDILYNNAGAPCRQTLLEITPEQWHTHINIVVTSSVFLSQAVVPHMQSKGKGVILFTCSEASFFGHVMKVGYIASKHAIAGLTRCLASELGPIIRVNAVAPGATNTPWLAGANPSSKSGSNPMWDSYLAGAALRKLAEPEDVAAAALFLASDDASHITGQIIKVDGGRLV